MVSGLYKYIVFEAIERSTGKVYDEPCHGVVGLAVVAEAAGELERLRVPGDEHPALAGRNRLRRCERPDPGVAPRPAAPPVPVRAVGVRAVLDQEDALSSAELGDLLDLEGDVPADVDDERGAGTVPPRLLLEVGERHAEVVAVAVDELDVRSRSQGEERRRHERVGRAEDGLPADAGELEGGQRGAAPAREGHCVQLVPGGPRRLELRHQLPLGPALGVEHPVPQLVEPRAIAVVEANRKAIEGSMGLGFGQSADVNHPPRRTRRSVSNSADLNGA